MLIMIGIRTIDDKLDRRDFVKAAVAIGGMNALAACVEREEGIDSETTSGDPAYPRGPSDLEGVPERQFAWNGDLARDPHGNTVQPRHQVLLFLRYPDDSPPTVEDRDALESSLTTIERAFQRGTGGKKTAATNSGLLFLLGYTPSYFDRLYGERPDGIDLPTGVSIMDDLGEDSGTASDYDAFLLLASDYGSLLLNAEEALFGDLDEVNGLAMETDLSGVFEVVERRTDVIGRACRPSTQTMRRFRNMPRCQWGSSPGSRTRSHPRTKSVSRTDRLPRGRLDTCRDWRWTWTTGTTTRTTTRSR